MTKIVVVLLEPFQPCHTGSRIGITLSDGRSEDIYIVDGKRQRFYVPLEGQADCCEEVVATLYSPKLITSELIGKIIAFEKEGLCIASHNCSDLVNMILDDFFPIKENPLPNALFYTKKAVCCIPGVAFFCMRCAPAPFFINTPTAVFIKAKHLSRTHGKFLQILEAPLLSGEEKEQPKRKSDKELSQLSLYFSILSKEDPTSSHIENSGPSHMSMT